MKISKEYVKAWLKIYSCNVDKNIECNKRNCAIYHKDRCSCTNTSRYKYAKKTPINFIKKTINKIIGAYKYE